MVTRLKSRQTTGARQSAVCTVRPTTKTPANHNIVTAIMCNNASVNSAAT